ncbi:MAG TPA: peptide chain release factor N(5)-glutamine methyltransferase [Gaiellales bacterium]|nr:peptide chain release factor N(5)-glutamine methyltransferase [Gaiellales bacterium]
MRTLGEVLRLSTAHLERHGSPTARLDAELLLGHALGLGRVEIYTGFERPLDEAELAECRALIARRAKREPVAYILGRWGFRGLDLDVDPRVLVPRPETELLVDRCLALLNGVVGPDVLDVGTGSGAIALALASELPEARVIGCDVSPEALEVARRNGERLGVDVEWIESDLLAAVAGRRFDLVVSNPPYVAADEIGALEPEVRDWEPRGATVAGESGLEAIERLCAEAPAALEEGGALVLEVGAGQAGAVAALLEGVGLGGIGRDTDHAGIERIVWGRAP